MMLDNNLFVHKESMIQSQQYVPYTTTSMIDTTNSKFYENFWGSMIKEKVEEENNVERNSDN